jgi:hypothetical protein
MLALLPWFVPLAGCGTSPLPPLVLVRLPLDAAPGSDVPATTRAGSATVELLGRGRILPGHLDRDAVLVAAGPGRLEPLAGLRWSEPLRDVVPRLLRADLSRLLRQPVVAAPAARDAAHVLRLEVEIAALDLGVDARTLEVRAAWQWRKRASGDGAGSGLPDAAQRQEVSWSEPVDHAGATPLADAVALAHRNALAQLARRIAASAP